jgi:aspartate/methionine/tyrosine aminotransferase
MSIQPFKLERYFAKYEFKAKYLLSSSDCESLGMEELLDMATPETQALWQNLKLGYTESTGNPLLRIEIAKMYAHITPDDVLVSAPEEAIFIMMHTMLKRGDHAVVISPAYQSLAEIAHSIGCRVTPWQLRPDARSWQIDITQLERSLTPKTQLLVINFPHNPTGHMISRAEFDAILTLAEQHDLPVFSDEMYRLLEWEPSRRLPPICDVYQKGISLSGLSKSFALPGLRLGWLATREHTWIEACQIYKDYTTICNSAPSEVLGIVALQNQARILQRNLEIVQSNLALAEGFFKQNEDRFRWYPPKAGSIAFPEWIGKGTVEQFCQQAIDQQGVMIVPGSLFEYPGNYFRIGLGRRNFGKALANLVIFLKNK